MKTNKMNPRLMASLAAMCLFNLTAASGGGLPEPGLVMYGMVTSTIAGAPLLSGTVAWQVTGGSPSETVAPSSTLVNVNGQYYYIAWVPFETRSIPGLQAPLTKTPGTLALAPAGSPVSYSRAATVNGTNATIVPPKTETFSFSGANRGTVERVDLTAPLASQFTFVQWLASYGLPSNLSSNLDLLGKGMTLYQDYVAGTNPTNRNSLFKMETSVKPVLQGGQFAGITIQWESVAGKTYSVYRSTDLGKTFNPLQTAVSAAAPLNSLTDPTATGPGPYFYRLEVR